MTFLDYMFMCHKRPERSFFYKGKQLPLCSRCTGICVGYVVGMFYVFFAVFSWTVAIGGMVPLVIDGTGQLLGYWESNNFRRFLTGTLFGTTFIHFLILNVTASYRIGTSFGLHLVS